MRKGRLPNQAPNTTQDGDERGQLTAKLTVLVDVDFENAKVRTRELSFINGRLAKLGAAGKWQAYTPVDVPAVPETGLPIYYGESTTGNDTYVCACTPTLTALAAGVLILLKVDAACSGAATLNADGLGAKNIRVAADGTATFENTIDNSILANDLILLAYNATNDHFRLLNVWR
ncbi:MAG: hypothetical protein ACYDCO_01735 [Armatimonadota bacterium]